MPRTPKSTQAPLIDDLVLDDLADGDPADLITEADLESLSFTDVVRPHLTLRGARITGSRFTGLDAGEADLSGARVVEVALEQVNLPVVKAARSQWRDVRLSGRLGSLDAYDTRWRSVHFVDCKLSFANLRGAELIDVAFTRCQIEELDLLDTVVRRVRFRDTRVSSLNVQKSDLQDFDLRGASFDAIDGLMNLRGATVSPDQLTRMAPLLADGLGLKVEDGDP